MARTPLWGAAFWAGYYGSINQGTPAPWLDQRAADIRASLRVPSRLRSLRELALQLGHSVVTGRLDWLTARVRTLPGLTIRTSPTRR